MTDRLPIDFFNTEALNLTGAAVIVTGSSRGIGKAIALALAAEGANVLVNFTNDRSQEAADAVAAAISALGCKSAVVQADIGDPAARETILQAAIDAFGGVDILINNAGITRIADAPDETPEEFESVIRVNLAGTRFLTQLVTNHMIARGQSGAVVDILSISSTLASDNRAGYCESKAGVEMNMKIHAGRLLQHRIKVNGVNVGIIATDLTADRLDVYRRAASLGYISMMRIGQPKDVALAVLYALRCYDTGAVIPCSGGVQLQTLNVRSMTALT